LTGLFPIEDYPALLIGLDAPDDAAVYSLNAEQAIISTMDFFPPVVDDPYAFGAIAAANALSDVYAMGGEPLMAINLAAFPDNLDIGILSEILRGGAEKVKEAGAVIAGGHTVTDREPKYGLAVTGIVHPAQIIAKHGAQPGDKLVLTKQLGTGVITTALKQGVASTEHVDGAVSSMSHLNREASRIARNVGVHTMTDITGYSLLGHSHEMAHLSGVNLHIHHEAVQWLGGARTYAEQGIFPGGMSRNRIYFEQWVHFDNNVDDVVQQLLFDPQTSGGLLMGIEAGKAEALCDQLSKAGEIAAIIGDVRLGDGQIIIVSSGQTRLGVS
jgi:selenide, water dikinase